ncbi:hypothetical protein ACVWZK_008570 [Bradyrhizobium sp. GM0.4]
MRFGNDGGLFAAYLPEAAYWALQADLKSGRLKFIKAKFIRPLHGYSDLTSIYFSETPAEETVNSIRKHGPCTFCAEYPLCAVRRGSHTGSAASAVGGPVTTQ